MPSAPPEDLSSYVRQVQLVGRTSGRVKQLRGFDKARHTVPDAVTPATTAFLGRLCAADLMEEAEQLFQRTRALLQYKRRDLTLDVSPPTAVLTAKDFAHETGYELNERAPDNFDVARTLHQVASAAVVRSDPFNELFAGQFSEVAFRLRKGVQVEAVIDAVEGLDAAGGLHVDYPSDCRHCTLSVEGVDATVTCDGASLAMIFPRHGSPRELLEAFGAVRQAFVLAKQQALAGLL